jgi:gliding motility-associated-like protein
MQIFDTWGNLIYNEESTSNELNGWKGRISGKDGENGNYFYQVSGNTQTDEKFSQNGTFTLIK